VRRRSVIDYSLARRARLGDVRRGLVSLTEACDAHPYLLRAAKHHGEPTEIPCPVCRRERLTHVTYTYGDELGQSSGRVRVSRELPAVAQEYSEITCYTVEVCRRCEWNHLVLSFVIGHGRPRTRGAPRRRVSPS
jgi:Family of unknown function (DUF5318)